MQAGPRRRGCCAEQLPATPGHYELTTTIAHSPHTSPFIFSAMPAAVV
jgi:hypothetical protein